MRGDDTRTRSLSHFRLSFHIWDCQMPPGFAGCGKMKKFYSFLPSLCLDCQNRKRKGYVHVPTQHIPPRLGLICNSYFPIP